ncbi:MAG: hypothetical protein AAGB34_11235, partial [Planctomycetota bacterium]
MGRTVRLLWQGAACLSAASVCVSASSAGLLVEDFDDYADTADLLDEWMPLVPGQPVITLALAWSPSGGRA